MNILFLYEGVILPERGGVQRVTSVLADEFARRGNGVFYLSLPAKASGVAFSNRQIFLPENDFGSKKNKAFLLDFLKDKKIDVVINQGGLGVACSSFAHHAQEIGVPVVSVLHNGILDIPRNYCAARGEQWKKAGLGWILPLLRTSAAKKILMRLYIRKYKAHFRNLARSSQRIVLLSEGFKKDLEAYFPPRAFPGKVCAIPNPVSFPEADVTILGGKKKELLYVGRLERGQKRVDLLLKIWESLEKRFPEWALRIVGDGPDAESLRALAGTLGLKRVSFEGFQAPRSYYECAAIFCMTSTFEGFPMVLVEAASLGCVPVAFDSFAAVNDIIADDESGSIVPAFDCEKYAKTLARLMSDDALRERLAKNALAQIPEKFSPEKIAARWEMLFRDVVSEKRKV